MYLYTYFVVYLFILLFVSLYIYHIYPLNYIRSIRPSRPPCCQRDPKASGIRDDLIHRYGRPDRACEEREFFSRFFKEISSSLSLFDVTCCDHLQLLYWPECLFFQLIFDVHHRIYPLKSDIAIENALFVQFVVFEGCSAIDQTWPTWEIPNTQHTAST